MLQPFLQFGIVADSVPFETLVSERQQRSEIVTSCHNCLVTRVASNLAMCVKSDLLPGPIRAHASNFEWSFVSCGNCVVHCLHRQRRLDGEIRCDHHQDDFIRCLHLLGTSILLIGHQSGNFCVWDTKERCLLSSVTLDAPVKLLTHPCAYVNKVLLTLERDDGKDHLILWNVKSCASIAQYQMRSKVHCCVQSPAIDVCAIGLDDGTVSLLHLQKEQILFVLSAYDSQQAVTAITFHTEKPFLLAGRQNGTIDLFDLEERRLLFSDTKESFGRVTKLDAVAGCVDLFIAGYERNALIQWIIDGNGKFQQQRRQFGNVEPVSKCHFLPDNCDKCVAVCRDSFLIWCSPSDTSPIYVTNRRHYELPVSDVICANRIASTFLMPEWADMVVLHSQSRFVSLARMDGKSEMKRTADNQKLLDRFEPEVQIDNDVIPPSSVVISCCISNCGNFAALGYSCGHIVIFNLQSREERARLPIATQSIIALAFDLLNRFLLFGSEQGLIGIRPFRLQQPQQLADDKMLKAGITGQFSPHRNGNLFAVPVADRSVSIVRVSISQIEEVRNVVCDGPITFVKFSDDGRFLACSSLDSKLRLFDVASGSQLDCLQLEQPVVCFDFKDDLLLCACRGSLQLYVFACGFYYDQIKIPAEKNQPYQNLMTACLEQPACSTWRSLDRVEEILKNNRPEPALAKPKDAPFFLPAVPTLTGFKLVTETPQSNELDNVVKSTFIDSTELTKHLEMVDEAATLDQLFEPLKKMNAIQLEFELGNLIRMACLEDTKNSRLFERFISFLKTLLERRIDFDFVAALASRIAVKLCSEISDNVALYRYMPLVTSLLATAESIWKPIQQNYERSLCLVEFLKNDSI